MNKYIGIDVAKATLQVYIPKSHTDLELENSPGGLKRLYSTLKKQYKDDYRSLIFVYEPTGSYSTLLDRFSMKHSIQCFKVKPSQSSSFSKSLDNRNKSDKIDARLLHEMGAIAKQKNITVPHLDDDAHFLQSLYKYLRRIIKETTALSNYLEASLLHQEDPFIIKRLRAKIKRLETEEKEITQKILTFIKQNKQYKNDFDNITSIKGVGPVTGIALLYLFLRYPDISRNKLTALCGLDPVSKTSGSSVNKKGHISKQGNKIIRSTLFMPVLCATTFNQELKTFYEHLKSNGKHSTVAQIAVMKKLILLAHSLYKNNEKYDPERYLKYQQIAKQST